MMSVTAVSLIPPGEQVPQLKWKAQHPLAYGLFRQDFIDQQRCAFGHAPCPAAGTEAPSFTAKSDQMVGVTGLAAHPQKPVFETAAFQVVLELAVHVIRQFPALHRQMGSERRVVFFDDPIEKCLLGTVALVTTGILVPGGRPGRRVGHDSHPCDTVFLHSLSLSCGILKPQL